MRSERGTGSLAKALVLAEGPLRGHIFISWSTSMENNPSERRTAQDTKCPKLLQSKQHNTNCKWLFGLEARSRSAFGLALWKQTELENFSVRREEVDVRAPSQTHGDAPDKLSHARSGVFIIPFFF